MNREEFLAPLVAALPEMGETIARALDALMASERAGWATPKERVRLCQKISALELVVREGIEQMEDEWDGEGVSAAAVVWIDAARAAIWGGDS